MDYCKLNEFLPYLHVIWCVCAYQNTCNYNECLLYHCEALMNTALCWWTNIYPMNNQQNMSIFYIFFLRHIFFYLLFTFIFNFGFFLGWWALMCYLNKNNYSILISSEKELIGLPGPHVPIVIYSILTAFIHGINMYSSYYQSFYWLVSRMFRWVLFVWPLALH